MYKPFAEVQVLPEIESSGMSHIGPVREDNQDAICVEDNALSAERGCLYAVADGMGGYAHGGVASALALEKLAYELYGDFETPVQKALRRGVESANLAVYRKAQEMGAGRMGTTLTAICLAENVLHLTHVGDSRAYLIRDQRATCLTNDHTTVGDLVRMKVLSPDKVRTHDQRSILTKALGLALFVQPDFARHELKAGDRVVLCSDGVWSVIQDREFAELSATTRQARELSETLINLAMERGTDDNVSAITVHVHNISDAATDAKRRKGFTLGLRSLFSKRQNTTFYTDAPGRA